MELFNELLAEIEQIPAIDIHSHVSMASPAAVDLSEIILTPQVEMEFRAARVPAELMELESSRKKVFETAPYLEKIKSTTTYWCLKRIFNDLYNTDIEPHESDTEDLWNRVEAAADDPNWASAVLDKANVARVFATSQWHRSVPAASERYSPVLILDRLINEPFSVRVVNGLTEATGQNIIEVSDLRKAIIRLFENLAEAGGTAVSAAFNPQVEFDPGNRDSADRVLSLVFLAQKINWDDRKTLRSYVMDVVLKACAEHGMPFQLMLGVQRGAAGERAISAHETGMLASYANLFTRHPDTKFDVFTANETLAHELAVIARNYPNVYVSGYLDYLMFPSQIRKIARERVEMLPITKSNGFFSEADCVEWVYARALLIRRELARVLSQMVDEGYISMGTAVDSARHYLLENPKRIYRLERES